MVVIGDALTRKRRNDDLALGTDSRAGSYSYETAITSAWKAGNLLRHYGVRTGATVAIDPGDGASPPPILAFLGAAMLGGVTDFAPDSGTASDAKALLVPTARVGEYDPGPGTQVLGYGAVPDQPGVAHFEREAWSENPVKPPDEVAAADPVLASTDGQISHEAALTAAETVIEDADLTASDTVGIRAPLSNPGTVVAGVVAPLRAGATVLLDREQTGTVCVGIDGPESRAIDPDSVGADGF